MSELWPLQKINHNWIALHKDVLSNHWHSVTISLSVTCYCIVYLDASSKLIELINASFLLQCICPRIMWSLTHHGYHMQPHTTRLDHNTLKLLKHWTWQFVVLRPVCSILMIALEYFGVYPSWVSWTFTIILNISVSLALYSLVVFYHVFAKELAPHSPLSKFLCIKGIVFFCFWQVFSYPLPWFFEP